MIYPFVDLKDFRPLQSIPAIKKDFYLMVTALAPNKRVDIALEAFKELGLNLSLFETLDKENNKFKTTVFNGMRKN